MKKLTLLKVIGFFLFLCSVVSPFVSWTTSYEGFLFHWFYYSFAQDTRAISVPFVNFFGIPPDALYFQNYWSMGYPETICIFMFAAQILTLSVSPVVLVFKERKFTLLPVVTSVLIIGMMTYFATIYPLEIGVGLGTYELGFYLAIISFVVFLTAFTIEDRHRKKDIVQSLPENTEAV